MAIPHHPHSLPHCPITLNQTCYSCPHLSDRDSWCFLDGAVRLRTLLGRAGLGLNPGLGLLSICFPCPMCLSRIWEIHSSPSKHLLSICAKPRLRTERGGRAPKAGRDLTGFKERRGWGRGAGKDRRCIMCKLKLIFKLEDS